MTKKGLKTKSLKYLNEMEFESKKDLKMVKKELRKWIKEFIYRADGRVGSIEKCDFKNNEFFFFTDCTDILGKDVEHLAFEENYLIRRRKRNVMFSLFLREFIGEKIKTSERKCSHCGFSPMDIDVSGNGYYRHCPKCKRVILDTFTMSAKGSVKRMLDKIEEKEDG